MARSLKISQKSIETVKQASPLSWLSPETKNQVINQAETNLYALGEKIWSTETEGSHFLIIDGTVRLREDRFGKPLATLKSGDWFGGLQKLPLKYKAVAASKKVLVACWNITALAQVSTLEIQAFWLQNMIASIEAAITLYYKSPQIEESINDLEGKAAIFHALAYLKTQQGEVEQAIALYQQSLELKEKIGDVQGKAASLHQLAGIYAQQGEVEHAIALYEQSLQINQQINDLKGKATTLLKLGNIYAQKGEIGQAVALYQNSLEIFQQIGDRQNEAISLGNLGNAYHSLGQYQEAIELYQASLAIAREIGDRQSEAISLSNLGGAFARPGKTKIQAELYVGETYKTTLETEVEVTAFEPTQLHPLIAARSRPVPQPNLILQVRTQWDADISACAFHYHIDSYQPRLLFADGVDCCSQSLPAVWVERTRQLLQTTLEEAATSQAGDFRSRLASLGQYLWRSLFPEELQSTFRTIASLNHPFTLLIIADHDAWFPWELFHDGQKFLGDRLIIGRWFWELEKARPYEFPVGAVNVAHYASVEQPELWTELLHSSGAPPPVPMKAGIFHDMSLFESIRGLHLIRYGQSMEAANLQDAPVRVDSDRGTEDIERELQPAKLSLRRNHPLVSLSYVNAGQMELTALEQTWASTFLGAGCSAFVGSLWAVDSSVEAAFIGAFYRGIWAGQSLGVAFNTARHLAQAAVPESGDWLAYVLFGDPMARP